VVLRPRDTQLRNGFERLAACDARCQPEGWVEQARRVYRTRFMGGLNEPNVPDALRAICRKLRANTSPLDSGDARSVDRGMTCNPDCNKRPADCRNVESIAAQRRFPDATAWHGACKSG